MCFHLQKLLHVTNKLTLTCKTWKSEPLIEKSDGYLGCCSRFCDYNRNSCLPGLKWLVNSLMYCFLSFTRLHITIAVIHYLFFSLACTASCVCRSTWPRQSYSQVCSPGFYSLFTLLCSLELCLKEVKRSKQQILRKCAQPSLETNCSSSLT